MKRAIAGLLAAIFLLVASPAFAQATRTWVSGVGDDANPCSRTAPCKTFAGAISKTAAGGEINVLDPGGFGSVTITKSITIDGEGPMASILAVNVNGVVINGAGITVNLRNLAINGGNGTFGNGIRIVNAATVNIDNVTIHSFAGTAATAGHGISIETSGVNTRVNIMNSRIFNLGNQGILVQPTATLLLNVDNVQVTRATNSGIALVRNTSASISNSAFNNNINGAGVALGESTVVANISNSVMALNQIGIANGITSGSTTRLYASVITGNTTQGLQITTGSVISLGNNMIQGNGGNQTPSSTIGTQ